LETVEYLWKLIPRISLFLNQFNHIFPNLFCGFFCVRLAQPRSLGTGYSDSNLVGVRKFDLSAPVSSLHLAQYTGLHTPLVHIYAWWEWERVILAALSWDIAMFPGAKLCGRGSPRDHFAIVRCMQRWLLNYITSYVCTRCMLGCACERGTQYCKRCQPTRAAQTTEPAM
jgi:hypothetical protein